MEILNDVIIVIYLAKTLGPTHSHFGMLGKPVYSFKLKLHFFIVLISKTILNFKKRDFLVPIIKMDTFSVLQPKV